MNTTAKNTDSTIVMFLSELDRWTDIAHARGEFSGAEVEGLMLDMYPVTQPGEQQRIRDVRELIESNVAVAHERTRFPATSVSDMLLDIRLALLAEDKLFAEAFEPAYEPVA